LKPASLAEEPARISWNSTLLLVALFACLCFALQLMMQFFGLGDAVHSMKSELAMVQLPVAELQPVAVPDCEVSLKRYVF
jgi:hypothetical protein